MKQNNTEAAMRPLFLCLVGATALLLMTGCSESVDKNAPSTAITTEAKAQQPKNSVKAGVPAEPAKTRACPKDARLCPDGFTAVGRDPANDCAFFPCPKPEKAMPDKKPAKTESIEKNIEEQVFCPQDVRQCPDGSWVGRDPNNNCRFRPCPNGSIPPGEAPESPLE